MFNKKMKRIVAFSLAIMIPLNIANPLMKTLASDSAGYVYETKDNNEHTSSRLAGDISNTNIRLSNIEFSAGSINGKFDSSRSQYDLSLTEDEEYFRIKAKLRNTGAGNIYLKGPGGEIYPMKDGEFSENIPSPAIGEGGKYELRTRRIGNGEYENFYNIRIFRTDGKLTLKLNNIEQLSDGTKQLKVDILLPAGNNIATCNFGFKFDNKKLQLIDKKTKNPIAPGSKLYNSIDLHHLDSYGEYVWVDYYYTNDNQDKFEKSNINGQFSVDFGIADYAVRSLKVTEANKKMMTIYFKVLDDSFDENTIHKSSVVDPSESVRMVYYLNNNTASYTIANADMFVIEGLVSPFDAQVEQYKNGEIIISPKKSSYAYGETITITAKPNLGYEFTSWAENAAIESLVDNSGWRESPSFTFKMPNHNIKLNISLDKEFSKVGMDYDKNYTTLDFNAPYSGKQVLVIADPYKDGEISGRVKVNNSDNHIGTNNIVKAKTNTKLLEEKIFKALEDSNSKTYVDKTFVLKSKGSNTNIWVDKENSSMYKDSDLVELQKKIDNNYIVLSNKLGNMYDVNSNGKLDIILYDIPNNQSLFDINQLIGNVSSFGVAEDIIHLNVNEDVNTLSRKMAHEAQHIIFASNFKNEFSSMTQEKYDSMVPKWIDEGLSLMAERITLEKNSEQESDFIKNHINIFNNSAKFENGSVSLTNWENSKENETLVYMFFSYLTSQSNNDILGNFYKSYSPKNISPTQSDINTAIKNGIMNSLTSIKNFEGMNFENLHESFWISTYINDKTGVYGFRANREFENILLPINNTNIFDGTIKNLKQGTAIVAPIVSPINTISEKNISVVGIDLKPSVLTVIDNPNAVIDISPKKDFYNKNEVVTLKVTPKLDYKFVNWVGDVNDVNTATTEIIMSQDKTVSVQIDEIIYNNISYDQTLLENGKLQITDEHGNDILNGNTQARLVQGSKITISATPNERFKFVSWIGDYIGNESTVTIEINKDMQITPKFEAIEYANINYDPLSNGTLRAETLDGTAIKDNNNSFEVEKGTKIRLIAEPNQDYKFVSWKNSYRLSDAILEIDVNKDLIITPIFEKIIYSNISYVNNTEATFEAILEDNAGNIIQKNPTKIEKGTTIKLNLLTLPENFEFIEWKVNDKTYSKENISVKIQDDNCVIKLNIKEKDKIKIVESEKNYEKGIVKVLDENNNLISPGTKVYEGTIIQYAAENKPGNEFVRWNVMQDGKEINPNNVIIRDKGFLSFFKRHATQPIISVTAKLGLDIQPVFATKSTVGLDEPYLANLIINEPVDRELVKVIGDTVKEDVGFDSSIAKYALYLTSKDEFITITPKLGEYSNASIILDSKEQIKITDDIIKNGYQISKDTDEIIILVEPNPDNKDQKETYYIIDVVKVSDNREPKILVGYQVTSDTKTYDLSVELENTALNTAQFVVNLPAQTEILDINGNALTTYNTSKDTQVLKLATGLTATENFDIQQAIYDKDTGKLSLTFNKKASDSRNLDITSEKAFGFSIKIPNGVDFVATISNNDKTLLIPNIIDDYRFSDGVYDKIYLQEKKGAKIFIEVSSINDRYNDGSFDQSLTPTIYNNDGFNIYLKNSNGDIYNVDKDTIYYNTKDTESRYTTEFTFEDIPLGEYTLYIDKYQHLPIEKTNIVITNYDTLVLKPANSYYPPGKDKTFYLLAGDINDDGRVNTNDKNLVRYRKYYGKHLIDFTDIKEISEFMQIDINNDKVINTRDYNIVMSVGYGKGTIKD